MNYLHTSRAAWVASSERLASGGDHLCTDGLPATAAASARAERSSLPSSYGGEDKTIQERDHHPTACDVLYGPLGSVGAVHHRYGRPAHGVTIARAVDEQTRPAWQRQAALEAAPKPSKPRSQTRCS
jgi:hypothetical protein